MCKVRPGVDPAQPAMFQLDPTQEYAHTQVYAFPIAVLLSWVTKKQPKVEQKGIATCWEASKELDIEELADFLETSPSPEEVEAYLLKHGAKPYTKED